MGMTAAQGRGFEDQVRSRIAADHGERPLERPGGHECPVRELDVEPERMDRVDVLEGIGRVHGR
jgi:hypothetical protein